VLQIQPQATEGGDYVLAPTLKLWRKRPKAEALGDLGAEGQKGRKEPNLNVDTRRAQNVEPLPFTNFIIYVSLCPLLFPYSPPLKVG